DCTAYRHSSELRRQVHANVLELPSVSTPDAVTLVTHLTSDRYGVLLDVMKHWDAFELVHERRFDLTKFPQHKEEALIMWRDGEIEPFQ
ncbi:hypothetical protein LSH36_2315g00001, partial [Paralvinella palmiformis]